jgi:phospholipid transport system substrate-binding protein
MKIFTIIIKPNLFLSYFLIFFLTVSSLSAQADDGNPGRIVKKTIDQVLAVLGDGSLSEEQKQRFVYQAVRKQIEFNSMSQRILATNWDRATNQQKAEFVFLFEKILLNDYWVRMKNYSGERVEYYAVSIDREKYATVDTVIIRDGSNVEIPITYRMELKEGVWRAYDFLVESLSLVQNYRREYQAIIKNHGMQGLLEQMHREI